MSIEKYLHTSGKYKQLSESLRERLQTTGWTDDVYAMACQELSTASDTSLDSDTVKSVQKKALDLIPDEVRREILQQVRVLVEEVVEKA